MLFVCTANICRSAYAELVARHLGGLGARHPAAPRPAAGGVTFASAGTYGLDAHPINREIAVHLPAGVDASGFASRRLTRQIVDWADLILTAVVAHRRFVLDEYPQAFRKVLALGQFADAAADIEGSGPELVAAVQGQRPPMRPGHDVPDPYRRGQAANAAAAAQIDALLAVVVPKLIG